MRAVLLLILVLFGMAGCSRGGPAIEPPLADLAGEEASLPEVTPYDDDVAMRAIYLNYYWYGYRNGVAGTSATFCENGHPWYEVQREGWYDGQKAGWARRNEAGRKGT